MNESAIAIERLQTSAEWYRKKEKESLKDWNSYRKHAEDALAKAQNARKAAESCEMSIEKLRRP